MTGKARVGSTRPRVKSTWKVGQCGRKRTKGLKVLALLEQLKAKRIEANMSLETLSQISGYDRSQCNDWERGAHIPSLARFQDLCTVLKLRVVLESIEVQS